MYKYLVEVNRQLVKVNSNLKFNVGDKIDLVSYSEYPKSKDRHRGTIIKVIKYRSEK